MTNLPLLGAVLVLTLGASRAVAQAPPASPPPPLPATTASPVVLRPPTAPPPSTVAPSRAPAATQAATFAPVRAAAPASALPPDSVRPAAAASPAEPPANAVAQCTDGAFVVAPADAGACATHGGVLVLLPQRAEPRRPVAARVPVSAPAAARAAALAPDGATMRCKDGTYLTGAPSEGRCDAYGGVAALLAAPRTAPPPPLPRRP